MECIAKQTFFSPVHSRDIRMGERVIVPDDFAKANDWLLQPLVAKAGKPSLEDLINRAIQLDIAPEAKLKKMPYAALARLVKERS